MVKAKKTGLGTYICKSFICHLSVLFSSLHIYFYFLRRCLSIIVFHETCSPGCGNNVDYREVKSLKFVLDLLGLLDEKTNK